MGMIINIDQALKNREEFNILGEPLHQMMRDRQEAWEKENPIDLLFVRGTLDGFQETYSSSIGFEHAFAETGDYAVGPIFNTADGFSATYTSRTFQGGFIITQQVIEDRKFGKIKDEATKFQTRWHGDIVEYAMKSLDGAFGTPTTWGHTKKPDGSYEYASRIVLNSADTVDGDIMNPNKNPLFCKTHKTVKRTADSTPIDQSNMFYIEGLDIDGDDAARISKLADGINQVISYMENYKDDNGKYAGVEGAKSIVAANDPHLKAAITNALQTDKFNQGESVTVNPAYQRATLAVTPYLNDVKATRGGAGFFIVDKAYNEANHGLEFTERIPFTLEATETKRPKGITYDGRQRFDVNVASWRGIAYVRITPPTDGDFAASKFTTITPAATVATLMKTVAAGE